MPSILDLFPLLLVGTIWFYCGVSVKNNMMTMNKPSASQRTGARLLLVAILIACLTSTTTCFRLQSKPLSIPVVLPDGAVSPSPRLVPRFFMSADGNSSEDDKESQQQQQQQQADAAALQKQVDEMFPNESSQDEQEDLNLYNAAPLFTGGILTVVSLAFTAYLYYAGLTGDDPLMGHPK